MSDVIDRAMAQTDEVIQIAKDSQALLEKCIQQRDELRAALEEVCTAARRQLELHGKGLRPSERLDAAFSVADDVLAKAPK